jgi:hypothetical protein
MKAADFVMTAAVQVSDNNAGGTGGAALGGYTSTAAGWGRKTLVSKRKLESKGVRVV